MPDLRSPLDNLRHQLLTLGAAYADAINKAEREALEFGVTREEVHAVLVACTNQVVVGANERARAEREASDAEAILRYAEEWVRFEKTEKARRERRSRLGKVKW